MTQLFAQSFLCYVSDDSFYDTIDRTAEYDNEINNSSGLSPEEKQREDEQLRQELAKVKHTELSLLWQSLKSTLSAICFR